MRKIWVIAWNDVLKTLRSRQIYFSLVFMAVSSLTYIGGYSSAMGSLTAQGESSQAIYEASRNYLNIGVYLWPIIYSLIASSIASYIVVLEKIGRNFEPLMVTPLSVRQIWVGKALGMSLASLIIGFSLFLLVFLGIDFGEVAPRTGSLIAPGFLPVLTAIIMGPVVVIGVTLTITFIQLIIENPRTALMLYSLAVVGLYIAITYFTLSLKNINFIGLIYLGLIVILATVVLLGRRMLTVEKVVLSSKS